ncbi:MAG: oligopeptide/dipeptide ABC transporter ATP-binding protein [Peptoniphilaceae bacterium]|nr:ATP-binding cassette domain-containing protein [Peptoniphilaceae bacterium]MDY3738507.1 oligopeptide/dipeptide ABC transporter ATP-binding protein [Peptoniphilaceae bacterium]
MSEYIYEVKNIKKYFPIMEGFIKKRKVNDVKAVDDVSFNVKRGETIGIVGESGCGKSTLAKNLMMIQKPTGGVVEFQTEDGMKDITKFSKKELFDFRRQVQMVFQDPYSALNPMKKIIDSFNEPLKLHGISDEEGRLNIMEDMMKLVNLQPEYLYRYPNEFSGGQRQRICIARALLVKPEVLVLDEPVSALDVSIQAQVLNILLEIQKKMSLTYLFIAHDLSIVEYVSDKIIVMYLGQIMEIAKATDLYKNPVHPYTQALVSAIPLPTVEKKSKRIILEGDVPSPINKPSGCPFHTRCKYCMEKCKKEKPQLLEIEDSHSVACWLNNK